ncbi:hypothetical protein KM043_016910 [Ampulex compressa]|nr:hypothetical protein KM043_016910 [Ampulex compressa]
MGQMWIKSITDPDVIPKAEQPPTFDPMLGFPNGRKERVMIATEQEMIAAKVPLDKRDYCAHIYLELLGCQRKEYPITYKCAHVKHKYDQCEYEDYVLRMKEFERERRLLERDRKKQIMAAA